MKKALQLGKLLEERCSVEQEREMHTLFRIVEEC